MSKAKPRLPAFACAAENGHQAGMSLRDYFASAAMQGLLANSATVTALSRCEDIGAEHYAAMAYDQADAMLKAREEKTE